MTEIYLHIVARMAYHTAYDIGIVDCYQEIVSTLEGYGDFYANDTQRDATRRRCMKEHPKLKNLCKSIATRERSTGAWRINRPLVTMHG